MRMDLLSQRRRCLHSDTPRHACIDHTPARLNTANLPIKSQAWTCPRSVYCTRAHKDRRFPFTRRLRRGEATPMSTVRACLSFTAFEWPSKLNRCSPQCSSCFQSRRTTTTRQPCVYREPGWAGLLSYNGNVHIVPTLACTRAAMVNWICCYIAVPLLLVKHASALTRPQRVPGRVVCVIALRRPFARPKHAAGQQDMMPRRVVPCILLATNDSVHVGTARASYVAPQLGPHPCWWCDLDSHRKASRRCPSGVSTCSRDGSSRSAT